MKSDKLTYSGIVREYSKPLYNFIRHMVVSHEDASDILQDTLVKAYRKLWQLRDEKALAGWLFRIASNECNTFLRRRSRELPITEDMEALLDGGDFLDTAKKAEIKLEKALLTLSPQQKTVFCLRYFDELEYEEISKITGSRPETLKVSYHNAKERIKQYMEEN